MENLIKINKENLIFREQVNDILRKVDKKRTNKRVCLDFQQVNFISRSFADELLKIMDDYFRKNESAIRIINLKPNIKKFLAKIKKTRKIISREIQS